MPLYNPPQITEFQIPGQAQGDVIYFDGTTWNRLAAGTTNQLLQTRGAAASSPRWVAGQNSQANGSTNNPTTTSGTFAVIPQMTITMTTQGSVVLVEFSGTFNVQNNDSFNIQVFSDGVAVTGTMRHVEFHGASGLLGLAPGSIDGLPVSVQALITGLSEASHTFDVRWEADAGTARARTTERKIIVMELF